jgi:hypothetical protein
MMPNGMVANVAEHNIPLIFSCHHALHILGQLLIAVPQTTNYIFHYQ